MIFTLTARIFNRHDRVLHAAEGALPSWNVVPGNPTGTCESSKEKKTKYFCLMFCQTLAVWALRMHVAFGVDCFGLGASVLFAWLKYFERSPFLTIPWEKLVGLGLLQEHIICIKNCIKSY